MKQKITMNYRGHKKSLSLNMQQILKSILKQRKEILTAFIAKYNCQPEEAEQIIQHDKDGNILYCIRKKEVKK